MAFKLEALKGHQAPGWSEDRRRWEVWGHTSYLLVLDDGVPHTLLDHVPQEVFSPLTSGQGILNLGNCVGLATIAGVDVFVQSKTLDAFEPMLNEVTEAIARLPFDFNRPTGQPFELDNAADAPVLYHQWLQLRHWMRGVGLDASLAGDIGRILYDPHRRMAAEEYVCDVTLVGAVSPATLVGIAAEPDKLVPLSGDSPLRSTPLAEHLYAVSGRAVFPERVRARRTVIDVDTPENRFVKYVLMGARDINRAFEDRVLSRMTALNRSLALEAAAIEETLSELLTAPLFAEVGEMVRIPVQSTVLQRREGYRGVFQGYARLQSSLRYPIEPEDLLRVIDVKDVATLYEYWTYFKAQEAVSEYLGDPVNAVVLIDDDTATSLSQRTVLTWLHGGEPVTLAYNQTFPGRKPGASYSVQFRPDIVLEWRDRRYIFDAKFKLDHIHWDDGEPNYDRASSKREDLYKMHTYKEAIEGVRAAYVLYPGPPGAESFYSKRGDTEDWLEGIGAIPLRPGIPGMSAPLAQTINLILNIEDGEEGASFDESRS